jgi:hypothetical protein
VVIAKIMEVYSVNLRPESNMTKNATAEGGKVNKSQVVRDFLTANPAADSQAVIAAMAAKGVKVAPTLVYYVRSKLGQARRKEKRERVAASSRQTGTSNPVELVQRVKELSREVGGIANLKQLVDLLAE